MTNSKVTRFPEAKYKEQGLPEYNENPLISALPTIMSPVEAAKTLVRRPRFQSEELNLPCHIRVHAINRLTRDFFVPQTNHIIIEQKLSKLIRCSYLNRNPKTATFKRKLNSIRSLIQNEDLTTYMYCFFCILNDYCWYLRGWKIDNDKSRAEHLSTSDLSS